MQQGELGPRVRFWPQLAFYYGHFTGAVPSQQAGLVCSNSPQTLIFQCFPLSLQHLFFSTGPGNLCSSLFRPRIETSL